MAKMGFQELEMKFLKRSDYNEGIED